MEYLLTACVWLPLGGALILALLPSGREGLARGLALAVAGIQLLMTIALGVRFDAAMSGAQFAARWDWIPALGISFHIGVDGLSLPFVGLVALLGFAGLLASQPQAEGMRGVSIAVLMAMGALTGCFVSLDLFLFYAFFEFAPLPIFFLIGIRGGTARIYTAVKFLLYAASGSFPVLIAILYLADFRRLAVGTLGFGLEEFTGLMLPLETQQWLLLAFFVGFAVRGALVPLHTWLAEAEGRAPVTGAVLLAGGWLSLGGYGLLRFCPSLFPDAFLHFRLYFFGLALFGLLYSAILILMQRNRRGLIACFSMCQMGLVLLGISSLQFAGMQGSGLLLLSHGLIAAALLLLVDMLERRERGGEEGTKGWALSSQPVLSVCLLVAVAAAAAFPGLSGFAGLLSVVLGGYEAFGSIALASGFGICLLAVGLLRFLATGSGGAEERRTEPVDLHWREGVAVVPLLLCIIGIGLFPRPLYSALEEPVSQILAVIDSAEGRAEEDAEGTEQEEYLEDGGEEAEDGVTESATSSLGEG
jgi:NADH-quinone oxidoreductase subunit M